MHLEVFHSSFFLVFVFPTGCVRVNSSVGDGLGGFRLLLTYGCSLIRILVGRVGDELVFFEPIFWYRKDFEPVLPMVYSGTRMLAETSSDLFMRDSGK